MRKKLFVITILTVFFTCFGCIASAAENDWSIVNGYGSVKNTGSGVTYETDGSVSVNGYGGICYLPKAINEAVSIQFKITAYPTSSHYFNFGLLDTKNVFWNTSGTISKGIMARVSVASDGNTLQATGLNITGDPVRTIDAIKSQLNALEAMHMFTIYRDGENWIYSLDGEKASGVPIKEAKLGKSSYLSVGSYGSSSMEMTILNVFIDNDVTEGMKDGTYIKELAEGDSINNVYYDKENRLIIGEAVKNNKLSYIEPSYLSEEPNKNNSSLLLYILIGFAGISFVASAILWSCELKKHMRHKSSSNQEKTEGEVNVQDKL